MTECDIDSIRMLCNLARIAETLSLKLIFVNKKQFHTPHKNHFLKIFFDGNNVYKNHFLKIFFDGNNVFLVIDSVVPLALWWEHLHCYSTSWYLMYAVSSVSHVC